MQDKGKVIIVSGPSGVGKGTLLRELFACKEFPLVMSVSATTRSPRPGERNGVDYDFLTTEEFERCLQEGLFLEHFKVFGGAHYGTLKEKVSQALAQGQWIVLEIDVKGAREVLKSYPEALTFFIMPPDEKTLLERLLHRGTETAESRAKRIKTAQLEMEQRGLYQHIIVNDNLQDAVNELIETLRKEKS
ncbi:MAG: guanylate kinase [Planctomycetia bacterium]|nr:guanylate kinase [Planctomycetia bacterium]